MLLGAKSTGFDAPGLLLVVLAKGDLSVVGSAAEGERCVRSARSVQNRGDSVGGKMAFVPRM